jgi:hypothetical protein
MHAGMESHRFSVIVAHRRLGKTVAVINHVVKQALRCRRKAPFYAYLAPYFRQAKAVAWGYLKEFTAPLPGRKVNETELWVEIGRGARIRLFGADNPDALRGLYFDGVVLDEYADMKEGAWTDVIRPALSDRKGFAVFIGTPRGHNAFYDLYRNALRDPAWFTAVYPASKTGLLPAEELASARVQMTEAKYRQEYECDFDVSGEETLIPFALVEDAVGRQVGYHDLPVVMGVDVGLSLGGDPTAIVVRQGAVVVDIAEFRLDETLAIAGRIREYIGKHGPAAIYVDAIGWGAGVSHVLSGWGYPVQGVNVSESASSQERFHRRRDELWWLAREFFASRQCAVLPAIELRDKLKAELATPTYGYLPSGRIKVESKLELKARNVPSPNLADALVLTMAWQPPTVGAAPGWIGEEQSRASRFA